MICGVSKDIALRVFRSISQSGDGECECAALYTGLECEMVKALPALKGISTFNESMIFNQAGACMIYNIICPLTGIGGHMGTEGNHTDDGLIIEDFIDGTRFHAGIGRGSA